jgi:hypothetical protein
MRERADQEAFIQHGMAEAASKGMTEEEARKYPELPLAFQPSGLPVIGVRRRRKRRRGMKQRVWRWVARLGMAVILGVLVGLTVLRVYGTPWDLVSGFVVAALGMWVIGEGT